MFKPIGALIAVLLMAGASFAQTPAASFPRTADGKPDLSGVWQAGGISLEGPQANVVQPAAQPAAGARGAGGGAAPAGGRGAGPAGGRGGAGGARGGGAPAPGALSMQPWAAEKSAAMKNVDDPTVHCFMPGVPRIVSMPMPFEIVQTPKQVVILYEAFRAFRNIPTDGRKPVGEVLPSYMGDSEGRWEGDTLVVDVKNFNGRIWGPGNMKVTSDALHVVERYTPSGNTIAYEATIEDQKVLTQPYVYRTTLRRPPETRVLEYECLENNINLEHIVQ
jgi:hypothetical protein